MVTFKQPTLDLMEAISPNVEDLRTPVKTPHRLRNVLNFLFFQEWRSLGSVGVCPGLI